MNGMQREIEGSVFIFPMILRIRTVRPERLNWLNSVMPRQISVQLSSTIRLDMILRIKNHSFVVLGGGIMAQEQFLKERVECAVKRYLVSSIEEHTKIVFAKHQNDAGMLGAFYHFCSLH